MRQSAQILFALAAAVSASPFPQAVTSALAPDAATPTGCASSFTGTFGMAIGTVSDSAAPATTSTPAKRLLARGPSSEPEFLNLAPQLAPRQASNLPVACKSNGTLEMTLSDGVMKDAQGRTAAIVANRQFQFDGPPQAGSIYTAGWSVCDDGTIALGANKVFYQCLSGTFYNLYDQRIGGQCQAINMEVIQLQDCGASGTPTTGA